MKYQMTPRPDFDEHIVAHRDRLEAVEEPVAGLTLYYLRGSTPRQLIALEEPGGYYLCVDHEAESATP